LLAWVVARAGLSPAFFVDDGLPRNVRRAIASIRMSTFGDKADMGQTARDVRF